MCMGSDRSHDQAWRMIGSLDPCSKMSLGILFLYAGFPVLLNNQDPKTSVLLIPDANKTCMQKH